MKKTRRERLCLGRKGWSTVCLTDLFIIYLLCKLSSLAERYPDIFSCLSKSPTFCGLGGGRVHWERVTKSHPPFWWPQWQRMISGFICFPRVWDKEKLMTEQRLGNIFGGTWGGQDTCSYVKVWSSTWDLEDENTLLFAYDLQGSEWQDLSIKQGR